jgi:hypothetical protein
MRSVEESGRVLSARRWRSRLTPGYVALIVAVVGAMITSVALYIDGAAPHEFSTDRSPPASGTTVTLVGEHSIELWRTRWQSHRFAVVILSILVTMACLALFVAVQTLQDRRRFQSPMTTWYAAMLFAVVPLRNALPGSPAFGSWIDLTIVLWVMVTLVISMLLYFVAWWRHSRPGPSSAEDGWTSEAEHAPQ